MGAVRDGDTYVLFPALDRDPVVTRSASDAKMAIGERPGAGGVGVLGGAGWPDRIRGGAT